MNKGISESKVKQISKIKKEPKWMLDYRIESYKVFDEFSNPLFGPELNLNFDEDYLLNIYNRIKEQAFQLDCEHFDSFSQKEDHFKSRCAFGLCGPVLLFYIH